MLETQLSTYYDITTCVITLRYETINKKTTCTSYPLNKNCELKLSVVRGWSKSTFQLFIYLIFGCLGSHQELAEPSRASPLVHSSNVFIFPAIVTLKGRILQRVSADQYKLDII